jgi:cystathionine beta-synthase
LALVAASKGYRLVLVIPDKMSQEKVLHLRALGAEIVMTRSDVGKGHPQYYQDLAEKIASETPKSFYVNQFGNPANPLAHETTTAPEIWEQTNHKLDAIVCGVGSGGTITGMSRFFARTAPNVEIVLADPAGSVLAEYTRSGKIGTAGSWLVEGIGEDFIPPNCDLSLVKEAYSISDRDSFAAARELMRQEAILAGSSSGTLLAAALRYCRTQGEPKRVVSLVCDSGAKYLSKVFNVAYLTQEGFIGSHTGKVRDLVSSPHGGGAAIEVRPNDNLRAVFARMRASDVSQLPVVEGDRIVGLVTESDLLGAVLTLGEDKAFDHCVKDIMVTTLVTISADAPIRDLVPMFRKDYVAIVMDDERFLGLVTRIDLINYFRMAIR